MGGKFQTTDVTSERRAIGHLLCASPGTPIAIGSLKPSHFTVKELIWTFQVVREEWKAGRYPSIDVLVHRFREEGGDRESARGYRDLLESWVDEAERGDGDLSYYVERLRVRRDARELEILIEGRGNRLGVLQFIEEDQIDEAKKLIQNFVARVGDRPEVYCQEWLVNSDPRLQRLDDMRRKPERYKAVQLGIPPIDNLIGGLRPQDFCLIVAGTSVGKTSSLVHIADESWLQFKPTLFVTIEMSGIEIETMIDARHSGIDAEHFRRAYAGALSDDEFDRLKRMFEEEREQRRNLNCPLYVLDVPEHVTAADIDAHMTVLEKEEGFRFEVVIVDHLSLMSSAKRTTGGRLDWDAMGEVSTELKFLARKRDIALCAGVQARGKLSAKEKRRGGVDVIGLSYLIAQPADVMIYLFRDDDDQDEEDRRQGLATVMMDVGKRRGGRTGAAKVRFDYKTSTISEMFEE